MYKRRELGRLGAAPSSYKANAAEYVVNDVSSIRIQSTTEIVVDIWVWWL